MKVRALAFGLFAATLLAGCSGGQSDRLRISGEATFDGQPIPYGEVQFTPDGAKQNSGPQGIATIKDGKYDTSASEGKGFAGGHTVVRVIGLSGPGGKPLCDFEYRVELPRTDTTHDVQVPKSAAAKKAPSPDI
jgi:hypothetical protein